MKLSSSLRIGFALLLIVSTIPLTPVSAADTWSNWERRLDREMDGLSPHKVPGRAMGFLVPRDPRFDLLPMSGLSYNLLAQESPKTVLMILPAPAELATDGFIVPSVDALETTFGRFIVDKDLIQALAGTTLPLFQDDKLFYPETPQLLENQLALLKYVLRGKTASVKVLPVFMRFSDLNTQARDYAPLIADRIRDAGLDGGLSIVFAANANPAFDEDSLTAQDTIWLGAVRKFDLDKLLELKTTEAVQGHPNSDVDIAGFAVLLMKSLGADHGEILSYGHSGQMMLTKDKSSLTSYAAAAFCSASVIQPKLPHVDRERLMGIFDESARTEMLAVARQTIASILDFTAAKPPSLITREAGRKWPVYVSVHDPEGKLLGQAGSPVATGPLEESLRQYSFEALQKAGATVTKENFGKCVVEVAIPYGFEKINLAEDLVPFLNGLIVRFKSKETAAPPDAWQRWPDPHELCANLCVRIGLPPWGYATSSAELESFRILAFNEKEPMQDLGAPTRKGKSKKKDASEPEPDSGGGNNGGGGNDTFSF